MCIGEAWLQVFGTIAAGQLFVVGDNGRERLVSMLDLIVTLKVSLRDF